MPGNVSAASPSTVLPQILCRAFARADEWAIEGNEYRDGTSQRTALVATGRRRWRLAARLSPAAKAVLKTFYDACYGPGQAFYFYDPYETDPLFSYDPTYQKQDGLYVVRFDCPWNQTADINRLNVELQLVEVS